MGEEVYHISLRTSQMINVVRLIMIIGVIYSTYYTGSRYNRLSNNHCFCISYARSYRNFWHSFIFLFVVNIDI